MTRIIQVETFVVTLRRETPYLGPLAADEVPNERGYVVRKGNGTIYPLVDRSVVVRLVAEDGSEGWGETYGICAPRATCEIINDLLAPVLKSLDASSPETCWDALYDLMRVRGSFSGHYTDALAALDIALWDLKGCQQKCPLWALLGDLKRQNVPGYVSGLPALHLDERVSLARRLQQEGAAAFKFAAVVSREGIAEEMAALRNALGDDADIMIDLHWKFDESEALELAARLAPHRPTFLEAPVKPENLSGLAEVSAKSSIPIAAGEEWATEHQARMRLERGSLAYLQPEMAHTGITQFRRIDALAQETGARLAPHATIGIGFFLAASIHASAVAPDLWRHEWQHSIFDKGRELTDGDLSYSRQDQAYAIPTGHGLGVKPGPLFWRHAQLVD